MKGFVRQLNLELGHPTVDEALRRLEAELVSAGALKTPVIKLIHGYGSSGKGGKIRTACRKQLAVWKEEGRIADYIPGERFSIFDEPTRRAFARCETLRADRDLEAENRGMTILVCR